MRVKRTMRAWFLFEGRIGRVHFLLSWLLAFGVLLIAPQFLSHDPHPSRWQALWQHALVLGPLAVFLWVFMGLQIRRLHDLSIHGLWMTVPWLTVLLGSWLEVARGLPKGRLLWFHCVLLLFWAFLLIAPGKAEANRFGAPCRRMFRAAGKP
jgi:uncharacterized membrane protein YhaH (DUF805 family)